MAIRRMLVALLATVAWPCVAQPPATSVHARIALTQEDKARPVPAVLWLEAEPGTSAPPFVGHEHYTLLQKNRSFLPHLQIVPVGSAVAFPNADPFFHNVFSLFDGKRFDLCLYEAGSTKSVTFSREGVSYIFCNIHPEMSAVVIALSTPLYAVAGRDESFVLGGVPVGSYRMHLWVEGVPLASLDSLTRTIRVEGNSVDLGTIPITVTDREKHEHANKFGQAYAPASKSPY